MSVLSTEREAARLFDTVGIPASPATAPIGVVRGEGIGPAVVDAALAVLGAVAVVRDAPFSIEVADAATGPTLSDEVERFCSDVFGAGGAVLAGAVGGRFVYDLRARFDLFCKLSPLRPFPELAQAGVLRPDATADVDVVVVREQSGGIYQGEWSNGDRAAAHSFAYDEGQVARIAELAAGLAARRRGQIAVAVKRDGVPTISRLWSEGATAAAAAAGVRCTFLEVDYAAYALVRSPRELDVLLAPNLFGDVLSDVGCVLLGSRGLAHGVSIGESGRAVYGTNHGSANDLAGQDVANPAGQILALALLLDETLGLRREAALVRRALRAVWADGFRTRDVAEPGTTVVGTRELGDRVAAAVVAAGR